MNSNLYLKHRVSESLIPKKRELNDFPCTHRRIICDVTPSSVLDLSQDNHFTPAPAQHLPSTVLPRCRSPSRSVKQPGQTQAVEQRH